MLTNNPLSIGPLHTPLEDNDPFEQIRLNARRYGAPDLLISIDHPDIVIPDYKFGAVAKIKPTMGLSFDFKRTEITAKIAGATNCMTYGLNRHDLGQTVPHGYMEAIEDGRPTSYEAAHELLKRSVEKAGFIRIRKNQIDPEKNHVLALFGSSATLLHDVREFEVVRRDRDGWSAQPGNVYPRQEDRFGTKIEDPSDDALRIGTFLGYYQLDPEGVLIDVPSLVQK